MFAGSRIAEQVREVWDNEFLVVNDVFTPEEVGWFREATEMDRPLPLPLAN